MRAFQSLLSRRQGDRAATKTTRARGKCSPGLERLEGRALLNADGALGGSPALPEPTLYSTDVAAETSAPVDVGSVIPLMTTLDSSKPVVRTVRGRAAARPVAVNSPLVQAGLQLLQADLKALRSRVPADLAARIEADRSSIEEARAALTQVRGAFSRAPWSAPYPDQASPTDVARIATMLRNSGVTDQNVNAVLADYQVYKRVIAGVGPEIHARISATKADLIQKLGRARFAKLAGSDLG